MQDHGSGFSNKNEIPDACRAATYILNLAAKVLCTAELKWEYGARDAKMRATTDGDHGDHPG